MEYIITFFAGVLTFVSPCILPLIPIYISYISQSGSRKKMIINSLGFIIGFTVIFIALGVTFSALSIFVRKYSVIINILCGLFIIVIGLNFLNIIKFKFNFSLFNVKVDVQNLNFLKSLIFGVSFAFGWSPCLNAFLGSALLLVLSDSTSDLYKGGVLLFLFSLGLSIPFLICTLIINKLENTIDFIKKNGNIIKNFSGVFLIIIGFLMVIQKFDDLIFFIS